MGGHNIKKFIFNAQRVGRLEKEPGANFPHPILAAGAVVWRKNDSGETEFAVIHRPRYDDYSLAKGKVDPGESLPVTAVREIREETGYKVKLGPMVGEVAYPVKSRTKVVYYWLAEMTGGTFKKNGEVDKLQWLSYSKAKKAVSYEADKDVLKAAKKLLDAGIDQTVLYVRHGRAHQRHNWAGDDNLRPLDKKGRRQAEMLVPLLSAWKPESLYSAAPDRCVTTIVPLAKKMGLKKSAIIVDERYGDAVFEHDPEAARDAFDEVVQAGQVAVIASQGITIPGIVGPLIDEDATSKKGSVWVLSFAKGELVKADYLASPLAAR